MWNPFAKFKAWKNARKNKDRDQYLDNPNQDQLSDHDEKMAAAIKGQSPFNAYRQTESSPGENPGEFKIDLSQLEPVRSDQSVNNQSFNQEYPSYQINPSPEVIDLNQNETDKAESNYQSFVDQIITTIDKETVVLDESDDEDLRSQSNEQNNQNDEIGDGFNESESADSDSINNQMSDPIEFILDEISDPQSAKSEVDQIESAPVEQDDEVIVDQVKKPVAKTGAKKKTSTTAVKKPSKTKSASVKKPAVKKTTTSGAKKTTTTKAKK